jgi:hypothetical protein
MKYQQVVQRVFSTSEDSRKMMHNVRKALTKGSMIHLICDSSSSVDQRAVDTHFLDKRTVQHLKGRQDLSDQQQKHRSAKSLRILRRGRVDARGLTGPWATFTVADVTADGLILLVRGDRYLSIQASTMSASKQANGVATEQLKSVGEKYSDDADAFKLESSSSSSSSSDDDVATTNASKVSVECYLRLVFNDDGTVSLASQDDVYVCCSSSGEVFPSPNHQSRAHFGVTVADQENTTSGPKAKAS